MSLQKSTRREFMHTAAAGAVAAGALAANVHAAGSDLLRVGLIGCGSPRGGRGRGAAMNCVNGGAGVKLYAMADVFRDHLDFTRNFFRDKMRPEQYDVADDRCFSGFDAFQKLLAIKEIDLVVLATPPAFRPQHIAAAVAAGKHIFAEKPVAVDAPGVRAVMKACEEAKQKNLSVVSGLCWRYDHGMRETFRRILDGGIGDIVALQCTYNTGFLWDVPRQKEWSDVEWQMRNWLYFTWLSGDHNVEQHIHSLDKMVWAMKDQAPIKAVGLGGRQVRVDNTTPGGFGNIFDHHSVVYDFPGGIRCFASTRQQGNTYSDVSDHVFGTKGTCDVFKHIIKGEKPWRLGKFSSPSMYQVEHNELVASIRDKKPINNGDYMCKSTLMAIMGRMATYTGQEITWEKALNSKENLMPEKLDFGPMAVAPVARPGVTKFS